MPSDTYLVEEVFEITRGDDFYLPLDFVGEDVSGNTYRATARQRRNDPDGFDFSVDMALAPSGVVTIWLTDEQTRSMTAKKYEFDVEETSADITLTLFIAPIEMREDVTK